LIVGLGDRLPQEEVALRWAIAFESPFFPHFLRSCGEGVYDGGREGAGGIALFEMDHNWRG